MADVHPPPATPLSDRAQQIMREAEERLRAIGHEPARPVDQDPVLDILQEAIDQAREHLVAIRDMLEHIAGERLAPPR